jgi:hypothetical protein
MLTNKFKDYIQQHCFLLLTNEEKNRFNGPCLTFPTIPPDPFSQNNTGSSPNHPFQVHHWHFSPATFKNTKILDAIDKNQPQN